MGKKHDNSLGDIDYPEYDSYLNDTVFIVHDIMKTKKDFKKIFNRLYDYMKQGFEKPEVRKHPLRFKFTDEESEKEKVMEIRHFIINLILWSAFIRYDRVEELNSGQIFDASNPTKKNLYNYINKHIILPYREIIDTTVINRALNDIIYKLGKIYYDFALIMGLTMDMESFLDLREKFPRFDELLRTTPEENMQPKEIEDMLDSYLSEAIDIITTDKTNNIRPFVVSGAGINWAQFSQLAIMGGLKPDIEGNVNPIPISSNFIYRGLNSIKNFYIDGQAGCKPLILNKTIMGKSGYFSYKAMTLSSNYRISQTVDDCHSHRPIKCHICTKKHLEMLDGRYYIDDSTGDYKRIDSEKDKDLIGTTVLLRDPTTCCAKDGICHICYGDLYYTNDDPVFHAGRFAATQYCNPIGQGILSSKHMLKTNSDLIKFNEGFELFFVLNNSKIMLNMFTDEDFSKWNMVIEEDDVFCNDEIIGAEDFNYAIEKFSVVNKKTGKTYTFKEEKDRDIYLFSSLAKLIHDKKAVDGCYVIPFTKIDNENAFGVINIANNELTAPLKNIIKLMDRKDHYGCDTIDALVNGLIQLTIDSRINAEAVHGSMILKGLIRSDKNILLPPDFSSDENKDAYQLLTLSNAIIYNPALCVSLSFDNVSKQLISPITYKKYGKSDYDIFYKEDIYEDSLRYYKKRREEKAKARKMKKA